MHVSYDTNEHVSPLSKAWRFINLMVGNSRRYNCKRKGYRMKVTLAVMTVYVLMFTLGLFAGDLFATKVLKLEQIFGVISTGAVYTMGFSVIYDAMCRKRPLYFSSLLSVILIMTQTAFVFNLFPIQVQNIFYYIASLTMMVFVWFSANKDRLSTRPTVK